MKVCTDSCLFGAWISKKIETKFIQPKKILDIGSGTGLLSLMIAQKSDGKIDAVEIDEKSFQQTKENFLESLWHKRLEVFHADIKVWNGKSKYDLIISNPPFFENDLKSKTQSKNIAKHHEGLTLTELLLSVKNNLSLNSNFAVMLPFHRINHFKNIADKNYFYLKEELLIKQTTEHAFFRAILFFGTKEESTVSNELIIKNEQGNYTEPFKYLLKDYYL